MGDNKLAFDASRFSGWSMDPEKVIIVGIDEPPNEATRCLYDKASNAESVDEKTVRNMMVYGCVEPIIITKIGPDAYVVDGRGRVRALREANKKLIEEGKEPYMIPAIKRQDDEHKLFGVMVSANGFRREDDQLTKAEKVQQFLDLGRDTNEAAATFGVSETAIKQWLVLLELAAPVKKLVKQGKLSAHAASKLAHLPAEEQIAKAKEAIAKAETTGKRVTGKSLTQQTTDKVIAPPKRVMMQIVSMEERPEVKPEHNNFWSACKLMMGELSLEEVGLDQPVAAIIAAKEAEKATKTQQAADRKEAAAKKKAEREAERERKRKQREANKAKKEADKEQRAKDKAAKKAKEAKGGTKSKKTPAKKPTGVTNKPPQKGQKGPTVAKKKGSKTAAA